MNTDPFEQLSVQEREDLALCGVTTAEQLSRCSLVKLTADLKQARDYFPERSFALTERRLRGLVSETEHEAKPAGPTPALPSTKRTGLPTTGFHSRSTATPQVGQNSRKKLKQVMLHSPVRTNHPQLTVFAALSTILLAFPFVSAIILSVLVFTQTLHVLPMSLGAMAIATVVLPSVPFLFLSRMALCPVCHIRIFRFTRFPRNRGAHYLPLLGYNMTMALHLLFRGYYICPGCGTPVKLKKVNKHISKH